MLRGYLTQCTTAAITSVTWPKQYMTQWNISRILVTWLKPQVGSGESIRAMWSRPGCQDEEQSLDSHLNTKSSTVSLVQVRLGLQEIGTKPKHLMHYCTAIAISKSLQNLNPQVITSHKRISLSRRRSRRITCWEDTWHNAAAITSVTWPKQYLIL